jgi:hypothetical protein
MLIFLSAYRYQAISGGFQLTDVFDAHRRQLILCMLDPCGRRVSAGMVKIVPVIVTVLI